MLSRTHCHGSGISPPDLSTPASVFEVRWIRPRLLRSGETSVAYADYRPCYMHRARRPSGQRSPGPSRRRGDIAISCQSELHDHRVSGPDDRSWPARLKSLPSGLPDETLSLSANRAYSRVAAVTPAARIGSRLRVAAAVSPRAAMEAALVRACPTRAAASDLCGRRGLLRATTR